MATSFLSPLQYFYISWLPRFLDTYAGVGFGRELAQRLVVVYIAMDVGLVLGGFMVRYFARRWRLPNARLASVGRGVLDARGGTRGNRDVCKPVRRG